MNGYHFSEKVRRTLKNARVEAGQLNHEYVGTEHILLSMLGETDTVAGSILQNLSVDTAGMRRKVFETVKKGRVDTTGREDLPYTSRSKRVLELAMTEARELGHNRVGTDHLLLGLLREEKGIAAMVLTESGVTLQGARATAISVLGQQDSEPLPSVPDVRIGAAEVPADAVSVPVHGGGLLLRPRTSSHQIALVTMWWTLGIVVLFESLRPFVRHFMGVEPVTPFVGVLAGVEIVGALLFMHPRTLKYGALTLLTVFAVAIIAHLFRGEFPTQLLVYAAATHFILVQRTSGVRRRPASVSTTTST